jgi:hypothetical protein
LFAVDPHAFESVHALVWVFCGEHVVHCVHVQDGVHDEGLLMVMLNAVELEVVIPLPNVSLHLT